MKPILFNTEMVKAILDGRKTVTRRCVKYKYSNTEMQMRTDKYGTSLIEIQKDVEEETFGKNEDGTTWRKLLAYVEKRPPYKVNDILYVRETWTDHYEPNEDGKPELKYCYKADGIDLKAECLPGENNRWYPSIHMPKEAARIFLRVTGVRAERLRDITIEEIRKEGLSSMAVHAGDKEIAYMEWQLLWDSTINKGDLDKYGWDANPYVWVIEFEVIDKAAAMAAGMVVLKEGP